MKSEKEIKEYATSASDWLYVWGANGEKITPELMERLYRSYGSASYPKSYYNNKLKAGRGKMAADCSGFLCPLSGYDDTAQGYYKSCGQKGTIGSIPENEVVLVFKRNNAGRMYHVGIYLGDGTVAEMASSSENYQHKRLDSSWTHWGQPKWINYDLKDNYEIGWHKDNNGWWYADSSESFYKNCWKVINHHKYYFNQDGYALKGWQQIDGKWYYFEPTPEHPLECAMYIAPDGEQYIGEF